MANGRALHRARPRPRSPPPQPTASSSSSLLSDDSEGPFASSDRSTSPSRSTHRSTKSNKSMKGPKYGPPRTPSPEYMPSATARSPPKVHHVSGYGYGQAYTKRRGASRSPPSVTSGVSSSVPPSRRRKDAKRTSQHASQYHVEDTRKKRRSRAGNVHGEGKGQDKARQPGPLKTTMGFLGSALATAFCARSVLPKANGKNKYQPQPGQKPHRSRRSSRTSRSGASSNVGGGSRKGDEVRASNASGTSGSPKRKGVAFASNLRVEDTHRPMKPMTEDGASNFVPPYPPPPYSSHHHRQHHSSRTHRSSRQSQSQPHNSSHHHHHQEQIPSRSSRHGKRESYSSSGSRRSSRRVSRLEAEYADEGEVYPSFPEVKYATYNIPEGYEQPDHYVSPPSGKRRSRRSSGGYGDGYNTYRY